MESRSIVIEHGFTTADLKTVDDCDHADVILTEAIATIEGQIADPEYVAGQPEGWIKKANAALRFKRVALQLVQQKRGTLRRDYSETWAKRFVDAVRIDHPLVFNEISRKL